MKITKLNKLSNDELFAVIDAYESSDFGDEDIREVKKGSKWRQRPRRSKTRRDEYDDISSKDSLKY